MIERKAHAEAAFLERQCAEVALACTGHAVLIVDRSGHVTHLNAAAELMTAGRVGKHWAVRILSFLRWRTARKVHWTLLHCISRRMTA